VAVPQAEGAQQARRQAHDRDAQSSSLAVHPAAQNRRKGGSAIAAKTESRGDAMKQHIKGIVGLALLLGAGYVFLVLLWLSL